MPVIRQYQGGRVREPGAIRTPQATPQQFGSASGQAITQVGRGVGDIAQLIGRNIEQQEVSDTNAKLAGANADLTNDLQEVIRTAEPGDNKPFDDYNKRVDQTFEGIGTELKTRGARQQFQVASARIKAQMSKTATMGQADLSGEKAVQDYLSTQRQYSAATLADPSAFKVNKDLAIKSIDDLIAAGNMPASKRAELVADTNRKVTSSMIQGWAKLDPKFAKEKLDSGQFDEPLGAEGILQLNRQIDQAERATEIEKTRLRVDGERIKKQSIETAKDELLVGIQKNEVTATQIRDDKRLDFAGRNQVLNILETKNKGENALRDDAGVVSNLWSRMHLPDGDPNKITDETDLDAFYGQGLSLPTLQHFRNEISGGRTQQGKIDNQLKTTFTKGIKSQLTSTNELTGLTDPIGDQLYMDFLLQFLPLYNSKIKEGVSAQQLLDPKSKEYIGGIADQFRRTPEQVMKSMTDQLTGGTPIQTTAPTLEDVAPVEARRPDESAAQYLERKKGNK